MPSRTTPGIVSKCWRSPYVGDYAGFLTLVAAYLLVQFLLDPFHRLFYLDDRALQYPHAEVERVSVGWLFLYAGGIPLALFLCWAIGAKPGWHESHITILGLFVSLVLSSFITDVVKDGVGRPRPDLIARCKPAPGTPSAVLVNYTICTETNRHLLHDGFRSFPSGHSSFAFSGLGYLAIFVAAQFHSFRPNVNFARALLPLVPLLGALMIAISRLEDYRHDVYDVTAGAVLGFAIAIYTYRRYFPSLWSEMPEIPYPTPSEQSRNAFHPLQNDEEALREPATFSLDDMEDDSER